MKPSTRACLDALRRHPEGLTPLVALEEVGTLRLGARVYELKAEGFDVEARMIRTASGKSVASYTLHETEQLRWTA